MEKNKYADRAKTQSKLLAYILLSFRRFKLGPSVLDLHGLKLEEGLEAVRNYLSRYYVNTVLKGENIREVSVITGTGKNTENSSGVLRKQVKNWLDQKRIQWRHENDNQGCFVVRLSSIN